MASIRSRVRQIDILTPIYDPSGIGFEFFRRAVDSVFRQRGVNWHWTISVQETGEQYGSLLAILEVDPRISISFRPHVSSLSQHLSSVLEDAGFQKVHLLCHDDFYTSINSLAVIAESLDSYDLLHIEPVVRVVSEQGIGFVNDQVGEFKIRDERKWVLLHENIGINIRGGLTATAWRNLSHLESLRLDLFADLELRRALRQSSAGTGVLLGGAITEHSWPGQAQHWQSRRLVEEATTWVAKRKNEPSYRMFIYGSISGARGHDALASAWSSAATSFWARNCIGVVRQARRMSAHVLRYFRIRSRVINKGPTRT